YAKRLIEQGPSSLSDVLPYWVVAQINRFAILLLPIFFLLLPLIRVAPALYRWRMRSRVYRYYASIREIDIEVRDAAALADLDPLRTRLGEIDEELATLRLPLPYRDYAYTARLHVDLVRNRLRDRVRDFETA
ncbi:MAG: C4-dicarboxylate ABC transporter substrate-binding protein, partial [Pseudomonadota bacterium]